MVFSDLFEVKNNNTTIHKQTTTSYRAIVLKVHYFWLIFQTFNSLNVSYAELLILFTYMVAQTE